MAEHGPLLLYWLIKQGMFDEEHGGVDIKKYVRGAEHFVCDEVMEEAPGRDTHWGIPYYPSECLTSTVWSPPYTNYWIEYALPLPPGTDPAVKRGRTGGLFKVMSSEDVNRVNNINGRFNQEEFAGLSATGPAGTEWYTFVHVYVGRKDGVAFHEGLMKLCVAKDGSLTQPMFLVGTPNDAGRAWGESKSMQESLRDFQFIHGVLNSPRVTKAPIAEPNKRIARAVSNPKRNTKYRYHILVVRSKETRERKDGATEVRCIPWHRVRGHWHRYTGEVDPVTGRASLLFGKYKRNVWVADFVRGELQHGKVEKDYWVES